MQEENSQIQGQWKVTKKLERGGKIIKLVEEIHSCCRTLYFLQVHDLKITQDEGRPLSKACNSVATKSIFK